MTSRRDRLHDHIRRFHSSLDWEDARVYERTDSYSPGDRFGEETRTEVAESPVSVAFQLTADGGREERGTGAGYGGVAYVRDDVGIDWVGYSSDADLTYTIVDSLGEEHIIEAVENRRNGLVELDLLEE